MSAQANTAPQLPARGGAAIGDFVKGGAPIVGLTAYTAPIARLLDPHVDFLLVGRFARHGGLRLRQHPAGDPRHDDRAWRAR